MDLIFDPPWYVPAAIAAVGIGVFVWGNNRLRVREKRVGIGIVLLAALLMVVAYLVETDREVVDRQTRELVRAVVEQDAQGIGQHLDRDAMAFGWNRQDIVDGALHYAERTGLNGARILGLNVVQEGNDLVSYLSVWSLHDSQGIMAMSDLNSQWKLEWTRVGERWLLIDIVPMQVGPMPRDAVEQQYFSRPPTSGLNRPGR